MDCQVFKKLYLEVALSVDVNLLAEPQKVFGISIKTRTGEKYRIARRKTLSNRVDTVETAIYQLLDEALLISNPRYVVAIPYEEIVEISAEVDKNISQSFNQ